MKQFLLSILLILALQTIFAQQVEEFSLIRENNFALNPAVAGTKGFLYGTATARYQFTNLNGAPYTVFLGFHGQVENKNFGLGGYLVHDVTGPNGKTGGTFSASYHLKLGGNNNAQFNDDNSHLLSFGISVSVMQYRLDGSSLHPENVNDPLLFTSHSYKVFPDAAFGVYYHWRDHLYAGISCPQIMGLDINYQGRDGISRNRRVQHINFLIGGKLSIVKNIFSIDPVAAFRWANNAPPQGDAGLRLDFVKTFFVGTNYRSLNHLVLEGGIHIKDIFFLSYAYDYNFSNYRTDIGQTHEVTLSVKFKKRAVDR